MGSISVKEACFFVFLSDSFASIMTVNYFSSLFDYLKMGCSLPIRQLS